MCRKAAVEQGWKTKAAEEADLILSDGEDSEEEFYQVKPDAIARLPACARVA